ncbi:MAG: zinc ABC transporter substrate-binding protein [Synechococcales bacterium]|nr:zinc ABC transporter substrate-binding protein [Synechococcales bacterium]
MALLTRSLQSTFAIATSFSLLAGCTPSQSNSAANSTNASSAPTILPAGQAPGFKVVAANSVLCDMTQQIAAQTIDLTCLVKAGQDPHVYEATPADRKAIETAKLVLYGGYGMEPEITKLVKATSNPAPKIAVHELAVPKPLVGEHDHHGEKKTAGDAAKPAGATSAADHGHDHGSSHGASEEVPDPHVWHSAQNGIQMVQVIQKHLSQLSPENAALYQKNAQAMTDRLTKLDGWIKDTIATIPAHQRKLVTTHDALGYYAAAYQIPVEGALQGVSTEEKPTAARLKTLVDQIKATQVPTIFAETSANPKLLETVAKDANIQLSAQKLYTDGIGESGSGAETYEKTLISNTKAIVSGLGGTVSNPPL